VPVLHAHVAAVPLEARELGSALTDARVVVAVYANVLIEVRETTGAAAEAGGRRLSHQRATLCATSAEPRSVGFKSVNVRPNLGRCKPGALMGLPREPGGSSKITGEADVPS